MSNVSRVAAMVLVGLAAVGVVIDPYSSSRTASDFIELAPWWQYLLAVIDLVLLGAVLRWAWTRDARKAWRALIAETGYHIVVAIVFILRDGIERFIVGVGASEMVSQFLLFILVRTAALYVLMAAAEWQIGQRAVEPGGVVE